MNRIGDWMQTARGRMFWPIDPRPDEVFIDDIAHALAMQCRFGGHCKKFLSVAEHSIFVSRLVPKEFALAGLLHDAAEAYVADVPRPLKRFLANYKGVEEVVWLAIAARFSVPVELPAAVKIADEAMLIAERDQNMAVPPVPWSSAVNPAPVELLFMTPEEAEHEFLYRFEELSRV